jgi:hypothetical protein
MNAVLITHSCGHTTPHNAWGKRIPWLESKPCPACAGLPDKPAEPSTGSKRPAARVPSQQATPADLPPGFQTEYRFAPPRRWRFDYAWPEHRVALEIEGAVYVRGHHARGQGIENDMEKYNQATFERWRVFRASPRLLAAVVELYIRRLVQ